MREKEYDSAGFLHSNKPQQDHLRVHSVLKAVWYKKACNRYPVLQPETLAVPLQGRWGTERDPITAGLCGSCWTSQHPSNLNQCSIHPRSAFPAGWVSPILPNLLAELIPFQHLRQRSCNLTIASQCNPMCNVLFNHNAMIATILIAPVSEVVSGYILWLEARNVTLLWLERMDTWLQNIICCL